MIYCNRKNKRFSCLVLYPFLQGGRQQRPPLCLVIKMGNIIKGTTPTFVFSFTDFDPTTAEKIIASFSNGLEITEADMDITTESISVWLSQEQSLSMPQGGVTVQINFLFADGQRVATSAEKIDWENNLHNEVMA